MNHNNMKTELFDYDLPPELIAQTPIEPRDHARLLVVDRKSKEIYHQHFYDLVELLDEHDHLVVNDTKVINARLLGQKASTSANIECFLLDKIADTSWHALVRPGAKVRRGDVLLLSSVKSNQTVMLEITDVLPDGKRIVKFISTKDEDIALSDIGITPLPPYIKTALADPSRYQTVYAEAGSSTASPTAGLHFTERLIKGLQSKGVGFSQVRLDIGLDTFRPIKSENIDDHVIHSENFCVSDESANLINEAISCGKRIVAVGTTSVRVLESCAVNDKGRLMIGQGMTNTRLFIKPGYQFKIVNAMITNFHLPRSTLIVLVSAFMGHELTHKVYREAIENEYRFFSFGDGMMIL